MKIEPIETTAHHFEVCKKDIYELLRGNKYLKPSKKREPSVNDDEPIKKKQKEEVPKQAHHVVTTLVSPPTAEDQAAASSSMQ